MGSKVKPKRKRKKKTKNNSDKKDMKKDNFAVGGKGKEKTVVTPVATAPVGEMDLDDKWADLAFVPPSASTPASVPAVYKDYSDEPEVIHGVIVTTLELGFEDTLLKLGDTVTVVSTKKEDHNLISEKGKLLDFDSEVWGVQMLTGKKKHFIYALPSLLLHGHGGTVP